MRAMSNRMAPRGRASNRRPAGSAALARGVRGAIFRYPFAGVIQLVECQLPKLDVAGSSPVARSSTRQVCSDLAEAELPRELRFSALGMCPGRAVSRPCARGTSFRPQREASFRLPAKPLAGRAARILRRLRQAGLPRGAGFRGAPPVVLPVHHPRLPLTGPRDVSPLSPDHSVTTVFGR